MSMMDGYSETHNLSSQPTHTVKTHGDNPSHTKCKHTQHYMQASMKIHWHVVRRTEISNNTTTAAMHSNDTMAINKQEPNEK